MLRLSPRLLLALALAGSMNSASAFSLFGPYAAWQVYAIGYNITQNGDLGAPQNLGEEYRWDVKTIYYGFDSSFLNYFGQRGVEEVTKAISILNALPPVSQMSPNLTEFPTLTRRENYYADTLGILDLKSGALGALVEQIGLVSPERYIWTIRQTYNTPINYQVIMRNFDPVTYNPTPYVNGTLYTYLVVNPVAATPVFADAIELPVDPLAFTYTAVPSAWGGLWGTSLTTGTFFTGLDRDTVGGLRYLYRPNNYNIENLTVTNGGSNLLSFSSPWTAVGTSNNVINPAPPWTVVGTNGTAAATNTIVGNALRPGVDKLVFVPVQYDSIFGTFIQITNTVTDTYVTNSALKTQTIQRVLTAPDIVFTASDLLEADISRSVPVTVNNSALNSQAALNGPGVISGQVVISFNKIGPYNINANPSSLDESTAALGIVWGAFDGTTNAPFIFPGYISVQDLEQRVLGGR